MNTEDQSIGTRNPIRVLLVDDDQGDFEMTRALLSAIQREKIELDWVTSFEEGLAALERDEHDVYLLDYFLEDRTGLDLLREAGERGVRAPVIMLTGRGNFDIDLKAMKGGAADYLIKGKLTPDDFERSIRYALERQRAKKVLLDSEERHRGMFDHLPIGLYRSSMAGEFMDANPALVRMLGFPDPAILRAEYASGFYVAAEDLERFQWVLEEEGVARGFESMLRRPDGTTLRVRNTARVHRDPGGERVYVEGAVEEVSDAGTGDGSGGNSERLRALMDMARSGIAIVDLDGRIVESNSAFRQILGFDEEGDDPRGLEYPGLLLAEDAPAARDEIEALREGRTEEASGERRLLRRDKIMLWARVTTKLVRSSEGEPVEIIVLIEDVSETIQVPHRMD